jgi:hypothetical protein
MGSATSASRARRVFRMLRLFDQLALGDAKNALKNVRMAVTGN